MSFNHRLPLFDRGSKELKPVQLIRQNEEIKYSDSIIICIYLQGHCCDHLTLNGDAKGLSHVLHLKDEETGLVTERLCYLSKIMANNRRIGSWVCLMSVACTVCSVSTMWTLSK